MIFFMRVIKLLPISEGLRLSWQRSFLERYFSKEILKAKKLKNNRKIEELESDYRFEIDFHDESEDAYLTKKLISKARKLRVAIPHRSYKDENESEYWYEGQYTGRWYLTTKGITVLRAEIRSEIKAQYEGRVFWLSNLIGLIGAVTGLLALLLHK